MSLIAKNAPRFPAIPSPDDPTFNARIKEVVEIGLGIIGDKNKRFVTADEITNLQTSTTTTQSSGGGGSSSPSPSPDVSDKYLDQTVPPAPQNLSAVGSMNNIILTWDDPELSYYSHTEIWRSQDTNLANASFIGTAIAPVYVDEVGSNVTRYYWIRFVSYYGKKGPYDSVNGTQGISGALQYANFAANIDPVSVVSVLPNPVGYTGPRAVLLTTNGKLYRYDSSVPEFTTDVDSGDLVADSVIAGIIAAGAINTPNLFVDGVITGVKIVSETLTGDLIAANEILGSHIAANELTGNHIQSNTIEANHMNVTSLAAITANMGSINAGDITLNSAGFIRGGQTGFRNGSGFWLGYNSGYKLSLGVPGSSNEIYFDGLNLYATGKIYLREFTSGSVPVITSTGTRSVTHGSTGSGFTCGPWAKMKEFVVTRFGTLTVRVEWDIDKTGSNGTFNDVGGAIRILVNSVVQWTFPTQYVAEQNKVSSVDVSVEPDQLVEVQAMACARNEAFTGYPVAGRVDVNSAELRCGFESKERVTYG